MTYFWNVRGIATDGMSRLLIDPNLTYPFLYQRNCNFPMANIDLLLSGMKTEM